MPVTFSELVKSQQTVTTTLTITGVAPTNTGDLIVIAFVTSTGTTSITGITGTNGLNGTWRQVNISTGGSVLPETVDVWWSVATSTTSGTLTCSSALSGVLVSYMAYDINGTTGAIVQNAIGNGTTVTSVTATLSALTNSNNVVFAFGSSGGGGETAGTSLTALDNYTTSPTIIAMTSTSAGSPTSVVMNCSSGNAALVAFELSVILTASDITSGLQGWWKMDEGSGTVTVDSSGNNNNGVFTGVTLPSWAPGKIGPFCLSFPSTLSGISVKTGKIIAGLSSWTIAGWQKTTLTNTANGAPTYTERASSGNDIVKLDGYDANSQNSFFVTYRNDAGTLLQARGANLKTNDNKWHHIGGVFNGSTIQLYLDGSTYGAASAWTGANNTLTDAISCRVGKDFGDMVAIFTGNLDDVRIYNRALSAANMNTLYNYGIPHIRKELTPNGTRINSRQANNF